jgi:hypothetical protein
MVVCLVCDDFMGSKVSRRYTLIEVVGRGYDGLARWIHCNDNITQYLLKGDAVARGRRLRGMLRLLQQPITTCWS